MIKIAIPQMGYDSLRRIYMKHKYVVSLRAAGAQVCWIDLKDPQKAVQQALKCDGLLLPGGGDMDPALYGQTPVPACGAPNVARDTAEPLLLKAFWQADKPVLGICRGVQVMNVVAGGTLLQDITPTQKCQHSDFDSRATGCHQVEILPDTLLAQILGAGNCFVNSMHHQVADRPGEGLRVAARSQDGYIEALERPASTFCIGVQWHPEHMSRRSERQRKLFDAFVAACRR